MIHLWGRTEPWQWPGPQGRRVWALSDTPAPSRPADAYVVETGQGQPPAGYDLYLLKSDSPLAARASPALAGRGAVVLPEELDHLQAGDVIGLSADGRHLAVLWRAAATHNSLLLTEQCDNYCLMCSQPPRDRNDRWRFDQAAEVISLLPPDTAGLSFTGGEPTLDAERFLNLLHFTSQTLPEAEIHILSNGRRFADPTFTAAYAAVDNPRVMVGIPLYGTEPGLHDYVVQARGAFDDTMRGILNLGAFDQRIEIRVVLHRLTAPVIVEIAEYIARNIPFVDQVALMGLEIMGLARANLAEVWIDPFDYRADLSEAALLLDGAGIRTMIYNHQLCLLEPPAWPFAVKSISDWKNEYDPVCDDCHVRAGCGGFFHSAKHRSSAHIHPIDEHGTPLPDLQPVPATARWQRSTGHEA